MDVSKITKEEFLAAYNRHLPGKWTKFVFKYFSQSTVKEDLWLKRTVQIVLLGLFGLGMLGAIFNATHTYMAITTLTFSALLVLVALIMSSGAILNNLRIRKIRKELGITKAEYEILAQLYLY
jgi:hypothetical protein